MDLTEGLNVVLTLSGSFDFKDVEGNILKTIYIHGNLPLKQDTDHGTDDFQHS